MTPRQTQFCQQVASGKSGSAAARLAGYANANVEACRLLKRPVIRDHIAQLQQNAVKESKVRVGDLIDNLISIIEAPSIGTYLTQTDNGEVVWKLPSELTPEQMTAIKHTVPIRDLMQEKWSSIELHDKATAAATLIDMMQPNLTQGQRESIVSALTRLGSRRGFTAVEVDILSNSFVVSAMAPEAPLHVHQSFD